MFKAAIRVNKLSTVAQLRGASLHAQRHDETGKARVRDDAEPGFGLAWSKAENDRDYLAAFKAHKSEMGAGERKNAPIALQAICVVSPEWVEKAGNLHDPDNPHNRQLFDQAKAWAENWGGAGSVIATRLDLDEKGGAVVDVLVSPVRESRGKPVISTNKALRELKEATGERNEYSALQTSWADWCRQNLDTEIVRGTRKEITQRQHLSPETYGAVMDKARESVRAPSQGLWDAIRDTDLSERDTAALSAFLTLTRAPAGAGLPIAPSVPRWPRSKRVSRYRPGASSSAAPACTISQTPGALSMASALVPPNSVRSVTLSRVPVSRSTTSALPRSKREVGPAKKSETRVPIRARLPNVVCNSKPSVEGLRNTAISPGQGTACAAISGRCAGWSSVSCGRSISTASGAPNTTAHVSDAARGSPGGRS